MEERQQFEAWREDVWPVLVSKRDEFHDFGYDRVTLDDLWAFTIDKLKKKKHYIPLYAFVDFILSVQPQDYMTWITVNTYKEPTDWFKDFEEATAKR
ncbi:post-transcriptional regulator [Shouchella shacheensis]|uniref:post-transcriptional regulator n=1 Tax=Shouchella shacheensis TaxID=1649580 RepID=UPI0007401A2F|nr:post-transcriptional regulator [Shouchella shacheensis]